jgi:hypothetical protein
LVSKVVGDEALLRVAIDVANQLALIPASAMRETKRILNASIASADSESFDRILRTERDAFDSPEHLGAVAEYEAAIRTRRKT